MGTRLLANTLKDISLTAKTPIEFDNIILASADIDSAVFKNNQLEYIKSVSKKISIYVSEKDKALWGSENILHSYPRVGNNLKSLCEVSSSKKTAVKNKWFFYTT